MTHEIDDETRRFLRGLFGEAAPRDVVPGSGLTREALKQMNDAADKVVAITIPGDVICDPDGTPIGVGLSRTETGLFGGAAITQSEADQLGWTAAEFPNIRVLPDPHRKEGER